MLADFGSRVEIPGHYCNLEGDSNSDWEEIQGTYTVQCAKEVYLHCRKHRKSCDPGDKLWFKTTAYPSVSIFILTPY